MEYKDYYKILGISRNASQEEIKRAYRKLAHKYHPDISKEPNAEQHFKEIGEAYEVLKDPQKQAAYNQLGTHWQAGEEFRPPPNWDFGFDFGDGGFPKNPFDFSDFFEALFGAGRVPEYHPRPGEDQYAKIILTLEEAYRGITRTIQLQSTQKRKLGRKSFQTRTLSVKIPPGVLPGQQIRLAGQGRAGAEGITGDLYLEIELAPHHLYRLEERDIYLTLPITPWEAALGGTVSVPTLAGPVDLKIPAGSQSGQQMRLKERGFPGPPVGNQYVTLQIITPPATTEAAQAFYRKMAQELPLNPRADLLNHEVRGTD